MFRCVAAAVAAGLLLAVPVQAQQGAADYPSRPARVIVDVAPGGGVDTATRLVAAKLEKSAELVYPAEVAMDCMALFSSTVISRPTPSRESTLKRPNERMTLVTPTPRDHPVRAPM